MKTITEDDRARLVALLGLAAVYRTQLEETVTAVYRVVGGESDLAGYVGDEVWGATAYGADELLRRLGVRVEKPTTTPEQAGEQARKAMAIARRAQGLTAGPGEETSDP